MRRGRKKIRKFNLRWREVKIVKENYDKLYF